MSNSSSPFATSDGVAPKTVACPRCGSRVVWDTKNRFRPFCSERCKMIDLGAWANEQYRVPVVDSDDNPAEPTVPPMPN